jgi:hypothetical protein
MNNTQDAGIAMKKIIYAPAVELSMSSLNPDGVRRVQAWFDYLSRWDEDESVRKHSLALPGHEGVQVLRTITGIWIFFRIDGDTITVLDVARNSAIVASGGLSNGGLANGGLADVSLVPGEKKDK